MFRTKVSYFENYEFIGVVATSLLVCFCGQHWQTHKWRILLEVHLFKQERRVVDEARPGGSAAAALHIFRNVLALP